MTRKKVLERLSCSANGFFFPWTARTASDVASLVHLFLSFLGIFLYRTLPMRYVDVLAKNSAILWDFTRYRIIAYYRRFGKTNHSHFKGQAVQKENLYTARSLTCNRSYPETLVTDSTILHRVKLQKISGLITPWRKPEIAQKL